MSDTHPRAVLRLEGSAKEPRVLVVVGNEIVGELFASAAQVVLNASKPPRLIVETIVSPHMAEVDLSPPAVATNA